MLAGYRVEEIIGIGGMGIVYRAEQVALRRRVALKVLSPQLSRDASYRERFRREGAHAAALHHPHVVPVFDSGEVDEVLYLAMMLVEGSSLGDLLDGGPIGLARTVAILTPIAAALDAAHRIGIVHRDVKPQNVLLDRLGTPLLADFGVAKASGSATSLTSTREFVGSINYSAPEQIRGEAVTPAADIYGLAAVLFVCLTGAPPFQRESEAAVLHAQLNDPPPTLGAAVENAGVLDTVLRKGMAKAPSERPASAGELIQALVALVAPDDMADVDVAVADVANARRSELADPSPSPSFLDGSGPTQPVGAAPPAGRTQADRKRPVAQRESSNRSIAGPRWGRWTALVGALALVAAGLVLLLDRQHHPAGQTHRAARSAAVTAASAPISLTISSPANATTTSSTTMIVRGMVRPVNAKVEVQGVAAEMADGDFSRTVPVAAGTNKIEVIATAPGRKHTEATLTVIRRSPVSPAATAPTSVPRPPTLEMQEPPDGTYTILVPSGWQYFAESSPEGTTTDVWLGSNSSEKLQVFTDECASCAESEGTASAQALQLPQGTVSSFEINPLATGFEARSSNNPNPDSGLLVVTRDGERANGYAQVDLWLPASLHKTATQILNSFSPLKATTG